MFFEHDSIFSFFNVLLFAPHFIRTFSSHHFNHFSLYIYYISRATLNFISPRYASKICFNLPLSPKKIACNDAHFIRCFQTWHFNIHSAYLYSLSASITLQFLAFAFYHHSHYIALKTTNYLLLKYHHHLEDYSAMCLKTRFLPRSYTLV